MRGIPVGVELGVPPAGVAPTFADDALGEPPTEPEPTIGADEQEVSVNALTAAATTANVAA